MDNPTKHVHGDQDKIAHTSDASIITTVAVTISDTKPPLTFESLPNEILSEIFDQLAPELVDVGVGSSLYDPNAPVWVAYCEGRRELLNLRCVSQHIKTLVEPLRFRNVVLSGPRSMAMLLWQLMNNPTLGSRIRQIVSRVDLSSPITAIKCTATWNKVTDRYGNSVRNHSGSAQDSALRRLARWFEENTALRAWDPVFSSTMLFAILSFANRLEGRSLRLPVPTPCQPRLSMWTWLLDEQSRSVERNSDIPHGIVDVHPDWYELAANPCWPPLPLRKVVVEFGYQGSGNNCVVCDILVRNPSIRPHVCDQDEHFVAPSEWSSRLRTLNKNVQVQLTGFIKSRGALRMSQEFYVGNLSVLHVYARPGEDTAKQQLMLSLLEPHLHGLFNDGLTSLLGSTAAPAYSSLTALHLPLRINTDLTRAVYNAMGNLTSPPTASPRCCRAR